MPRCDVYFKKLSEIEYLSYQMIWQYEGIHKEFEKVNKAGVLCPVTEICNVIFRDSSDSYIRVAKKDLLKTLSDIGEADILIQGLGVLGIDRKKVRCDYFEYLDGKPGAVNLYYGAYMSQYDRAHGNNLLKPGK